VCGSIGAGVGEQGGGCSDVPEGLAERKPAALEAVPGGLGPIEKKGTWLGSGADGCDRPRLVTETDRPRRVDADLVHARRGAGRSHKPPLQPPTREPQGKREPARRMSVPRFQRAGAVPEPLSSQRWSRALLPRTRRASVGPVGGDGVAHGRHGMGVGGRVGERHKSRRRGPERPAVKTRPAIAHFASVARSSTRRLDVEPLQDAAEARSTDLCRAA
jgi:hypothetical protein